MSTAALDLSTLVLNGMDAGRHYADLAGAIADGGVSVRQTITGASTVDITLADAKRTLLTSAAISTRSRLVLDSAGYTLVSVGKSGARVNLTFEDDAVALLRTHTGTRKAAAGTTTRAGFVTTLIREVPDLRVVVAPGSSKNLVELSRGSGAAGSVASSESKEDTWTAAGRIMGEIGWRVFCYRGTVTIAPDSWLIGHNGKPFVMSPDTKGVHDIDFQWDTGKPAATATITADAGFRDLAPGTPVTLQHMGPADGSWLVETIQRTAASKTVTVSAVRPQPTLPEPKDAKAGVGDFGIPAFLPDYLGNAAGGGGGGSTVDNSFTLQPTGATGLDAITQVTAEQFVRLAYQQRGKPYVYGAHGPNAWDCCLTGAVMVSCSGGPRRMDEIQAGDVVLTRNDDGGLEPKKVLNAWRSKDQETFRVRMRGRSVDASANHPFLRLRKATTVRGSGSGGGKGAVAARYEPEWVRLDQLQRGDILVVLDEAPDEGDPTPVLPDGRPVTLSTAWLLGAVVGDGTVSAADVRVAAFGEFQTQCISAFQEAFGVTPRPGGDKHGLIVSKTSLARMLWGMGFWRRGADKRVPDAVWGWSRDLQLAFAAGFAAADGHVGKDGQMYHNSSRRLIDEIRQIHILAGHRVSNVRTNMRTKPITIKGKLVKNALPLHSFTVSGIKREAYESLRHKAADVVRRFTGGNFGVRLVQAIEPLGVQATYDLEVEDNHNFVADGVVVHNSGFVMDMAKRAAGVSISAPVSNIAETCRRAGTTTTVAQAAYARGALIWRQRGGGAHDHIVISLGDGEHTIEAMGRAYGVVVGKIAGRDWTGAGWVPGIPVKVPASRDLRPG